MEHFSNNHEDHPNQNKNSHNLSHDTGHPVVNLMERQLETETATRSEFGGKATVEQILASEEIKIQKSRTLRITVWDLSRKVNHLSKVI